MDEVQQKLEYIDGSMYMLLTHFVGGDVWASAGWSLHAQ